jgi:hypothetical protein
LFFLPSAYLLIRNQLLAGGGSGVFLPLTILMTFFSLKVRQEKIKI